MPYLNGSLTNRGKKRLLGGYFRAESIPTSFYLALVTTTPTVDTNTLSDVTEIAAGNGYTAGGQSVSRNNTDFDVLTEDDTNNLAYIELSDQLWTASGGTIPASGSPAIYAVLLDDNATPANRDVLAFFHLGGERVVSNGNPLTLQGLRITLQETA